MNSQNRRERARKLRQVVARLEKVFGRRRRRQRPDPMETILFAIVADGLSDVRATDAFEKLRDELIDWNELRVTSVRDGEVLLSGLPDAAQKAAAIRNFLGNIFLVRHEVSAEFMRRWSGARAKSFLDRVDMMTESMRARALLKGFELDVLPITVEIVRVMKRVGVLDGHLTQEKAYEFLKEILSSKRTYAFFHLVNEHGDRFCLQRSPLCQSCPVKRTCDKFISERGRGGADSSDGSEEDKK